MPTIEKIKSFLKEIGSTYCLKNKQVYDTRLNNIKQYTTFPWREDQRHVVDCFLNSNEYKYYIINGIFGCGKTTLLFGLLINSFVKKIYKPNDCMFISFNISIKNEIRRKLKELGFLSKSTVSTFDSIIYKICKLYNYKYLDLPNFDGKRRFVYDICKQIKNKDIPLIPIYDSIQLIFIDEVQDLESKTLEVFQTFFSRCTIVFAGDIFQSIQKEPRESLLWYLLHSNLTNVYKICMKETPRVPPNILKTIQTTLSKNYPEFQDKIKQWNSSNTHSNCDVVWKKFYSYNHVFEEMDHFCNEYPQHESMILSFSSAITVKGNMGDVARFRKYLQIQGIQLNNNHKKIETDKLFLSTANSSKGLERNYVLCILTFPLELAFINFSNDIVLNIITVALTRAKKKVIFCVSAYKDKFCKVLDLFETCPKPDKEKIRDGKRLSEFTFSDYMNIEHNVTSLIKQSVIRYDTRIKLKEFAKSYDTKKIFEHFKCKRPILQNEEDRAFVGVLIENLITSVWKQNWPSLPDISSIQKNPMYLHCIKKIKTLVQKYNQYTRSNLFLNTSINIQFNGIFIFSQLYQAIYNKIFIQLHPDIQNKLFHYWSQLKPLCHTFKPNHYEKMIIQSNLRMPHLTGIADIVFSNQDEINIWEIKASIDRNWKDNALTQIILYSLMTGKSWSRLTLLNVFSNEKIFYHFNSKQIMMLRHLVIDDIIIYNCNCFLSKNYNAFNKNIFKFDNTLFVDITYENTHISQISILELISPTKCIILLNTYFEHTTSKTNRKQKLCSYSGNKQENVYTYINNFLHSSLHKDKTIFMMNQIDSCISIQQHSIHDFIHESPPIDLMNYEKNDSQKFSLDYEDSVVINVTKLCYLSQKYKFI